jgi:Flp pilus assembly protein TadD
MDKILGHPRGQNPALTVVVCIFLAAITWGVFGQTLGHDFLNYDDETYVYGKPIVTDGITLPGVVWAFTRSHARNWHPLTTISHMLDCQLFGVKPAGHHFTNVLLHSIAVMLLFLVCREMTGATWRSTFVAALFAIHPLRVESVAWVAERKDLLSGVFFMLTLAAYVRYVRKQTVGRYVLVAILFACGLMAKPMLVTVPLVLILLDYWPLQRIVDLRTLRQLAVEKIPLLVLSALSCVATIIAQGGPSGEMEPFPLTWQISNALVSYVIYIWQMFWPRHLAAFYPHPENQLAVWEIIFALVVLVAISGAAIALRRKYPYFITGWLWYLGMLVPVIGVLQFGMQGHADRYTYLPHIGLYLAIAWGVNDLSKSWRHRRQLLGVSAAIVLVALGWSARSQLPYWRNSEVFWNHILAVTSNNYVAHNNLGVMLERRGQVDDAMLHYRQTLKIQSVTGQARHNLGLARAHTNLASALLRKGNVDEAIAHCNTALKLRPNFAEAYTALGNAFLQERAMGEAVKHYEKSLAVAPESPLVLNNLALIFATCSDAQFRNGLRAIELAKQADELSARNNPSIVRTLAAAYAETGRFKEAIETARRAMTLALAQKDAATANDARLDIDLYELNLPRRAH